MNLMQTYKQMQRTRRANRPLPTLKQSGYRELSESPMFLLVMLVSLAVLLFDLEGGDMGLKVLACIARWFGGAT